jgi:hypothetical protein
VTARATCPKDTVLLGGGAQVTTDDRDPLAQYRAELQQSYPSSDTEWTAVGQVIEDLGRDVSMTVSPYALCSL